MENKTRESKGCMYTIVTVVLTVLMLLTLTGAFSQTSHEEFYAEINRIRKARLLPPLKVDDKLQSGSEKWVGVIITKHDNRLIHSHTGTAEVLAYSPNPANAWMKSKAHKKTILRRKYRFVGYAYKNGVACARFR